MNNRLIFKDGIISELPEDKTVNLIVLYSGGFDSTILLKSAFEMANCGDNKIITVYALNVQSDFLCEDKIKLEKKYVRRFIDHLNKKKSNSKKIKLIEFKQSLFDVESTNYVENAYDMIFINAINSVVPFIGGADINIVLGGALDSDSRGCHLPYYKEEVENFVKPFNSIETWMEFPLRQLKKADILAYAIRNKLYKYCTCCENPNSDTICNSCKGHALGLFDLLFEYKLGNIDLTEKDVKFAESELTRILDGIDD